MKSEKNKSKCPVRRMTAKAWCVSFFCIVLAVLAVLAGFNILIDPFGVFGDPIFDWYSYDMTNNPRAAKIVYLEEHHDEYDSYIVGASATSSYPKEDLDKYFDARFYNMIHYGADMRDTEELCNYLIDNYTVKNLVVCVTLSYGNKYDYESNPLTGSMHPETDGSWSAPYYLRYAFSNPQYAFEKLKASRNDTILSQPFDVFDAKTGAYDKVRRDIEPIGDMERYLATYPEFTNYSDTRIETPYIEETADRLRRIKTRCESLGIRLEVVTAPLYYDYFRRFDKADVLAFYESIANVMPFWDFSISMLSHDPRFFYDEAHFRNVLGTMSLAKMFDDGTVYAPDDLGMLVTPENAAAYVDDIMNHTADTTAYTTEIPILMYHHISETDNGLPPDAFEMQIKALYDNGYTSVSFDEMIAYVENGIDLPAKPVCITFDDGYLSNYETAFPILQKYNMKATIFVIGVSVGSKEHYKDTDYPITPHFDFGEAKEMTESGLISIQSHTYDMHQWEAYEDGDSVRKNILQLPGESEENYVAALTEDYLRSASEIEAGVGTRPNVLAYPLGDSSELSAAVLASLGVKSTLSIGGKGNTLIKGMPQSLYCLSRYYVQPETTADDVISYMQETLSKSN